MSKKILFAALLLSGIAKSQSPAFEWVRQIDGGFSVASMATDQAGNLYTTGVFDGTVDFDPGALVNNLTDTGFGDIFITKIDPAGHLLWARQIGGPSYDQGLSLMTDNAANVYITGFFSTENVDFDPGPNTFLMSSGENSFVLKLDTAGDFIWAKQISSIGENYARSLTLDNQGNILVTGRFEGTADFDPGAGEHWMTSFASDIYIWKLDNEGQLIWARQIECISTRSYAIAADNLGNIFISGLLIGTTDFDPGDAVFNLSNTSTLTSFGFFLLQLNAAGDFAWVKKIDNIDIAENDRSIITDHQGNLYCSGYFFGTVDFDPDAGVQNLVAATNSDYFLLKLNNTGAFTWVKQMADLERITLGENENIYTCGNSILKFSPDGDNLWNYDNALSSNIAVAPSGSIFTNGNFMGTVDFDPGDATAALTSNGNSSFMLKIDQSEPAASNELTVPTESFNIFPNPNDGQFYLQTSFPGEYTILNLRGQVVKKIVLPDADPAFFEINNFPKGIYFIQYQGQSSINCKKIIVQ